MPQKVTKRAVPGKCARCPFLDEEHDPLSAETHLYCQAPFWHPKRWYCKIPRGVERG
jgi:hypothetical protein